jgi:diaminopimelate epimerase
MAFPMGAGGGGQGPFAGLCPAAACDPQAVIRTASWVAATAVVHYTLPMDSESRHANDHAQPLRFVKMHGIGNDFVVVDARDRDNPVTPEIARRIGDRTRGVGFDQLVVISEGQSGVPALAFWNADGSVADACGNGTRCVARMLLDERGAREIALQTGRGVLLAEDAGAGLTRVNMRVPQQRWPDIPLAREMETDPLPLAGGPGAVGMGNPHCVFVVDGVEDVDLAAVGPGIENDPIFLERTNVEFIEVKDRETIRMRVWERGGFITKACGSGACAAVVVAARRGLTGKCVRVLLDGGELFIDWRSDGVWMTGPTELVFEGIIPADFLDTER